MSDHPSGGAFRRPNFFICATVLPGFSCVLVGAMLLLSSLSSRVRGISLRFPSRLNRNGGISAFSTATGGSSATSSGASSSSAAPQQPQFHHHDNDPPSTYKYSLVNPLYKFILKSKLTADPDLARFLAKSGAFTLYGMASMTALGTLGIDMTPVLTGIGITGFTIGFALKEITTNFLSGVMLVFGKPFRKGQWLKVLGPSGQQQLEGEVQSIDARYVLLRTKDRGVVMIPSVVVYTNPILVSGGSPASGDFSSPSATKTSQSPANEESK